MKNLLHRFLAAIFGLYILMVFLVLLFLYFPLLLVLPRLAWRRHAARKLSGLGFSLCAMKPQVRGMENLPASACIVVANHASYLDGIILTAVLPANFSFVIKREVTRVPFVHYLLRRIGSEFVERHKRDGKTRDSRRLLQKASAGTAMVFFPEGTFRLEPGLLPFHNGAFKAAARGNLPLVPLVICGARRALPARSLLPHWSRIEVKILTALAPLEPGPDGQRNLKESARYEMHEALGEPLVDER